MFSFLKKNREDARLKKLMERFVGEADSKLDIKIKYEEKLVGLLLIKLNNYDQLCADLNPDDLAGLLNTYYAKSVSCINKYGGNVDNLMGPKIFAIFGAPLPDENFDKNGILSAIDILDVFNVHNTNTDLHIDVTISFNIGIAMVGNFGSNDRLAYTAIGNEVNLLFKYAKLANRNSILFNSKTLDIISKYIDIKKVNIAKLPYSAINNIDDQLILYEILQMQKI